MTVRAVFAKSVVLVAVLVTLGGCTLTGAGREENRQTATAVNAVDESAIGARDLDCLAVPWITPSSAESLNRCLVVDLGDNEARQTATELADALAVETGGANVGVLCGLSGGAEVQCVSFASVPEARNANVEIWVALADDAVAELALGRSAGEYFVTFRLVPYGPDFYSFETSE